MHWGGNFGMGFGFGGIFMILFWVLLILLVVYLVKLVVGGSSSPGKGNVPSGREYEVSAEELLKRRFARGEINREEFENAMQVLRRHRD